MESAKNRSGQQTLGRCEMPATHKHRNTRKKHMRRTINKKYVSSKKRRVAKWHDIGSGISIEAGMVDDANFFYFLYFFSNFFLTTAARLDYVRFDWMRNISSEWGKERDARCVGRRKAGERLSGGHRQPKQYR